MLDVPHPARCCARRCVCRRCPSRTSSPVSRWRADDERVARVRACAGALSTGGEDRWRQGRCGSASASRRCEGRCGRPGRRRHDAGCSRRRRSQRRVSAYGVSAGHFGARPSLYQALVCCPSSRRSSRIICFISQPRTWYGGRCAQSAHATCPLASTPDHCTCCSSTRARKAAFSSCSRRRCCLIVEKAAGPARRQPGCRACPMH